MEQEVFKAIIGYEEYYEISNYGRVKSLPKRWSVGVKGETFLKPGSRVNNGYYFVVLCVNKVKKYVSVHRLVALHFCDNPNKHNVVNHLNGNKTDNRASNLEWTTTYGNCIHAFSMGLRKGQKGIENANTKILESDVIKIKQMYSMGGVSQAAIASLFGISQTHVGRIVRNEQWIYI